MLARARWNPQASLWQARIIADVPNSNSGKGLSASPLILGNFGVRRPEELDGKHDLPLKDTRIHTRRRFDSSIESDPVAVSDKGAGASRREQDSILGSFNRSGVLVGTSFLKGVSYEGFKGCNHGSMGSEPQ